MASQGILRAVRDIMWDTMWQENGLSGDAQRIDLFTEFDSRIKIVRNILGGREK